MLDTHAHSEVRLRTGAPSATLGSPAGVRTGEVPMLERLFTRTSSRAFNQLASPSPQSIADRRQLLRLRIRPIGRLHEAVTPAAVLSGAPAPFADRSTPFHVYACMFSSHFPLTKQRSSGFGAIAHVKTPGKANARCDGTPELHRPKLACGTGISCTTAIVWRSAVACAI